MEEDLKMSEMTREEEKRECRSTGRVDGVRGGYSGSRCACVAVIASKSAQEKATAASTEAAAS